MNWKIWVGILTLVSGAGYYLYTDNINSKVKAKLAQEQLMVNAKTEEIKSELQISNQEIVETVIAKKDNLDKQVIKAKNKIEAIPDSNTGLSPVLKEALIEGQKIIQGE